MEEIGCMSKRKTRNDIILITVLLLLAFMAALMLFLLKVEGDTVVVSVNGQTFAEYSLGEDRAVEIKNGAEYNLLIIKDGKAYIDHASCPDGICSSHRPICHDRESIICLPNKVVVEIRSQSRNQSDIIM